MKKKQGNSHCFKILVLSIGCLLCLPCSSWSYGWIGKPHQCREYYNKVSFLLKNQTMSFAFSKEKTFSFEDGGYLVNGEKGDGCAVYFTLIDVPTKAILCQQGMTICDGDNHLLPEIGKEQKTDPAAKKIEKPNNVVVPEKDIAEPKESGSGLLINDDGNIKKYYIDEK